MNGTCMGTKWLPLPLSSGFRMISNDYAKYYVYIVVG